MKKHLFLPCLLTALLLPAPARAHDPEAALRLLGELLMNHDALREARDTEAPRDAAGIHNPPPADAPAVQELSPELEQIAGLLLWATAGEADEAFAKMGLSEEQRAAIRSRLENVSVKDITLDFAPATPVTNEPAQPAADGSAAAQPQRPTGAELIGLLVRKGVQELGEEIREEEAEDRAEATLRALIHGAGRGEVNGGDAEQARQLLEGIGKLLVKEMGTREGVSRVPVHMQRAEAYVALLKDWLAVADTVTDRATFDAAWPKLMELNARAAHIDLSAFTQETLEEAYPEVPALQKACNDFLARMAALDPPYYGSELVAP